MSSYATVEEADVYVKSHYVSTDSLRVTWEGLSEEDKQVLLNVATEAIDSLPWPGRKADINQENAFPRCPDREVPSDILAATIENAISSADTASAEDVTMYQKMWAYGISSYSIGNLSETMGTASGNAGARAGMASNGIISLKAQTLLSKYMMGGYCIE